MPDSLVIVDSAKKAEICKKYFADKAEVVVSSLPVAVPAHKKAGKKRGAGFTFTGQAASQSVLDAVHEYQDKDIFLIFDADTRSQYLAWLISSYVVQISKGRAEPKLLQPLGFIPEELDRAMQYVNIVDQQAGAKFYTRAIFDAYLGKHLKRLVGTNMGPGNVSLNYTVLTTLFLLAERDQEVKAFVAQPKWEVEAKMRMNGEFFNTRLMASYDIMADGSVKKEEEARHIVSLIQDDDFVVEVVIRDKLELPPPAPYLLAELLHDALVLNMQPRKVLAAVRKLAHGIEMKGGVAALISSPFYVATDWQGLQKVLRHEVVAQFGDDLLGEVNLQILSGMICPLTPGLSADELQGCLTADELFVYNLICSRALASQMQAATGEYLQVEIAAGPESIFRVNFRSVQDLGFLQIYQGHYDKELLAPCPFAGIAVGQKIDLIKLAADKSIGVPAEKYTIESLFLDLADFSLGAEPAVIIMLQAMLDNDYIAVDKHGYLSPGAKAIQVKSIISKIFPRMCGVNLSAYIEQTMEEAVSSRKDLDFALKQFDQTLMLQGKCLVKVKLPSQIKSRKRSSRHIIKQPGESVVASVVREDVSPVPVPVPVSEAAESPVVETTEHVVVEGNIVDEVADKVELVLEAECEGKPSVLIDDAEVSLVDAVGGDNEGGSEADVESDNEPLAIDDAVFSAEDEWPDELKQAFEQALVGTATAEDDGAADIASPPEMDGDVKLLETDQHKQCSACGRQMQLKKDRFGKFWSCTAFPECRHTESFSAQQSVKMSCPVCLDGEIVVKRTPTGKDFYVCPKDDCEFIAWSKPHYMQCMACDSPYLVEKKTLRGEIALRCPRAGCDYSRPLNDDDGDKLASKKKKVLVRRLKKGAGVAKGGKGKKKVRIVRRRKK